MIGIIFEEGYINNNRAKLIKSGIVSVAKKKRIPVCIYSDEKEIPDQMRVVILICTSIKWTLDRIERFNVHGVHPLLLGFDRTDIMHSCSYIVPAYTKSTYMLTKYMLQKSPGKTAFIGFNEDSMADNLKLEGVQFAAKDLGEGEVGVFINRGNIYECIRSFADRGEEFHNIVCGNDGIALILKSNFPELLQGRSLWSCARMRISDFLLDAWPSIKIDYYKVGIQLAYLYLFLSQHAEIGSIRVEAEMSFSVEGKDVAADHSFPDFAEIKTGVNYYGDSYIRDVEKMENMLLNCDETDLRILAGIAEGVPYEQIAEQVFCVVNTVKYRIHAMLKDAEADSRKQLLDVIAKYGLVFGQKDNEFNKE